MGVKYSKFFTVNGAITLEPVTIVVLCAEDEDSCVISIESLEGEYSSASAKEFEKDSRRVIEDATVGEDKIYNFLPLMLPDAVKLVEALTEAIAAGEVK